MASELDVLAEAGQEFGKYTLFGKIAAGGMASVFLGRERDGEERWVAIKRVHPHLVAREDVMQMFLNEAKLLSQLHHENICGIIDFGVREDSPYIVMPYLHGAPLSAVLRTLVENNQPIPIDVMAHVAACVCEGLHYAHEAHDENNEPLGLVHRDISPQNIFITFEGKVSLLDFGVAKATGFSGITRTGHIKGKYAYMSPEQVEAGTLDRRSDVFSVGTVLWESLAGRHLFRRKRHIDTLRAISRADVPAISELNASVPQVLESIVARALTGDRRLRYQTAKSMGLDLWSYLRGLKKKISPQDLTTMLVALFPNETHPADHALAGTMPEMAALSREAHTPEDSIAPVTQPDTMPPPRMRTMSAIVPEGEEKTTLRAPPVPLASNLLADVPISVSLGSYSAAEKTEQLSSFAAEARTRLVDRNVPTVHMRDPHTTTNPPGSSLPVDQTDDRGVGRLLESFPKESFDAIAQGMTEAEGEPSNTVLSSRPISLPTVEPKGTLPPHAPAVVVPEKTSYAKVFLVSASLIFMFGAAALGWSELSVRPVVQEDPARALEQEGGRALVAGDLVGAEKLLLKCVATADRPKCHRSLGVLYATQGDATRSVFHYERYLELAPGAADATSVRKILSASEGK